MKARSNRNDDRALFKWEAMVSRILIFLAVILIATFRDPAFILIAGPVFIAMLPKCTKVSSAWATGFFLLLSFYSLSLLKRWLLGQPLLFPDLYYLRSNILLLAANDWLVLGVLIVIATVVISAIVLYIKLPSQAWDRSRSAWVAMIVAISILAGTHIATRPLNMWRINQGAPSVANFLETARITGYTFTPAPLVTEIKSEEESISSQSDSEPLPHLVFLMQESTISPTQLNLPETYQPDYLFAESPRSKTGTLTVNTFGGGSWLSLFSLIQQFRPDQLGPNEFYVTFRLEGQIKRNLFTVLNNLGYFTSTIYSAPGSFVNEERFFISNGLQHFDDPESVGIGSGWDWETPDADFLNVILARLNEDRPQAILAMTIAQHGPHKMGNPMADYLSRFDASDKAHGEFITAAFDQPSRPIVIVTFGDHQPVFMSGITNPPPRYETSYQIECYPVDYCELSGLPDRIDLTLLATYVFGVTGLRQDNFMRAQQSLFAHCIDDIQKCPRKTMAGFNWYLSKNVLR